MDGAVTLEELEASPTGLDAVLAPAAALPGMDKAVVGPKLAAAVGHGRMFTADVLAAGGAAGLGRGRYLRRTAGCSPFTRHMGRGKRSRRLSWLSL